jgi:hypothetical protein
LPVPGQTPGAGGREGGDQIDRPARARRRRKAAEPTGAAAARACAPLRSRAWPCFSTAPQAAHRQTS